MQRANEDRHPGERDAGGYVQEFSSHQALKQRTLDGVLARLPLVPGAKECSLWLRKA